MSVGIGIGRWTFRGTAMMTGATIKDDRVRRHMTSRESIELRRHAARGARSVEAEPASVHVCADPIYAGCSVFNALLDRFFPFGFSVMYERTAERHWLLHVLVPAQPGMLHPTRPSSAASIQPGASTATTFVDLVPTVVPPPSTLRTIAITSWLR